MKEMLWNEQYNLGIEEIDHVHRRLFYLINKLIRLNEGDAGKSACQETIQFFKKYSLHHFAVEERYMQYTGYECYLVHKSLHDQLRDETLPALENEMECEEYSKDAVQHFLGVCMGWLAGHIFVEDRAMIGKPVNGWIYESPNAPVTLAETAKQVFQAVSGTAQIVDENYNGKDLDQATYCYFQYSSSQKENMKVVIGIEKKAILCMFGAMLGIEFQKLDTSILCAVRQLFCQLVKMTAVNRIYLEQYKLEKEELITYGQLCDIMEISIPRYNILYDIGYGLIAFYVIR